MWAGIILFGLLQEPERCGALVDQARTNYENREYVRAALDFEAALSACPGGNRARLLLAYGQCQLMAQQLEQAAATFQQVTKLDPRNVEARKLAGDALYLLGRDSEAVASMKSALEIDPLNETVHYALGRIYYQSNQFPEAVEQFGGGNAGCRARRDAERGRRVLILRARAGSGSTSGASARRSRARSA